MVRGANMAGPGGGGVRTLFRLQRTIIALLFLSFLCGMVLGISLVTNTDLGTGILSLLRSEKQGPPGHTGTHPATPSSPELPKVAQLRQGKRRSRMQQYGNVTLHVLNPPPHDSQWENLDNGSRTNNSQVLYLAGRRDAAALNEGPSRIFPPPSYNVHIFYYPWYGTPLKDGRWLHWNHEYLPHWDKNEARKWPLGRHEPPNDIGSSFYPELGPYSSRDPAIMEAHMRQIRSAGIGVLVVSWYPANQSDQQGHPWDDLLPQLFDTANKYKLKVCLHIEPYKDRSHQTFRAHLKYIMEQYGQHPALYRHTKHGRTVPLYYVYDSYLTTPADWARLLRPDGSMTVRHTDLDGFFIGLVVEDKQKNELIQAGFDGFYTYFASDGFTYGSSTRNWAGLSAFATTNDAIFIPSIGPGYVDRRVRPWNNQNTKDREQGGYFEQSFKAALLAKPSIISITSFNEWHEGTQIERAVPKKTSEYQYLDYSPHDPDYYLMLTRQWVRKFQRHQTD